MRKRNRQRDGRMRMLPRRIERDGWMMRPKRPVDEEA